ncbi:hypothetical protein Bca52824_093362 [Brassica carinata]|uniref:Uncharacterized protein n=1 Tax=Brassica carinata TaxID=52824 RepID=A0A8X7P460_BRACI|nr:hypothetical protein Bca52824_093362 [Brassica carinata]
MEIWLGKLTLEANLHHRVLSFEWLNHVYSAIEMGSSRHILTSTRSSSKTAIGKRRGHWWSLGLTQGGLTIGEAVDFHAIVQLEGFTSHWSLRLLDKLFHLGTYQ